MHITLHQYMEIIKEIYFDLKNDCCQLIINETGIYKFKYIKFMLNDDISENIKKNMYESELNLFNEWTIDPFYTYDIIFLIESGNLTICNNYFIICLPNYMLDHLYVLKYLKIKFNKINVKLFKSISLIINKNIDVNLNVSFDHRLTSSEVTYLCPDDIFVQYIHKQCELFETNKLKQTLSIYSKYPTKGIFIMSNITNIHSVEILLNGHSRFKCESDMFDIVCNKLSDNLLYISYSNNTDNYKELTVKSYVGSTNHSKIDSCIIIITLKSYSIDNLVDLYTIYGNFITYDLNYPRLKYLH